MGAVTREALDTIRQLTDRVDIDVRPQEVPWTVPLDEDDIHAHYDPGRSASHLVVASQAVLVLAEFRGPYRGRSTPVNAWWGSFDLAVSLFSGRPAAPPSDHFIMRNAMDSQEVAVGWWPGDQKYGQGRLLRLCPPRTRGLRAGALAPAQAHWDAALREYILNWDDIRSTQRPAAGRPGVRPFGLPPRLRGVRLRPRPPGQYRRKTAARGLGPLVTHGRFEGVHQASLPPPPAMTDRAGSTSAGERLGPPRRPEVVDEELDSE